MNEKTSYSGIIIIIIAVIWIWSNYSKIDKLQKENIYFEDSLHSCQSSLDDYQSALEEANDNIEEANSVIEDAQSYAWSNYQDMGEALDNLYTVGTISEP